MTDVERSMLEGLEQEEKEEPDEVNKQKLI